MYVLGHMKLWLSCKVGFFFSSRRRHTRCALVTGVQTCALPICSFTQVEWTSGAQQLQRYNGYPSMTISGNAAPGQSTGEAMAEMERLANALPEGFAYEWTGMSYEEQQAGGQVGMLLGLSILVVFLLLAALYE